MHENVKIFHEEDAKNIYKNRKHQEILADKC